MSHYLLVKKQHRYQALLTSLIAFIFISPILPNGPIGEIIVGGLFLLVMLSASFNLTIYLSAHRCMLLFGILSLIFKGLVHFNATFDILNRLMMLMFFCTAIWIFSRDVFKEKRPGIDHIFGSILIYFLIGISYAIAFQFFQYLDPQQFILGNSGSPVTNPFDLYYLSFITLSTVGYGDIIANGQFAKILCIFESMTGIFYIATLVASLQSFFTSGRN